MKIPRLQLADKRICEEGYFVKSHEDRDTVAYIRQDEKGVWKYRLELTRNYGVRYFQHLDRGVDQCLPIDPRLMKHILRKYKEKGWI